MSDLWRKTLESLRQQFAAATGTGINHLFVETRDDEREFLTGPKWFRDQQPAVMGGAGFPGLWTSFAMSGLPSQSPSFRAFTGDDHESFSSDPEFAKRVISDKKGCPRAVFVPLVLRFGYFAGVQAGHERFRSLATACSQALLGIPKALRGRLPDDVAEICSPGAGLARFQFGELTETPAPVASGWDAAVYVEDNGVLIYSPEPFNTRDDGQWLLLLHRLGWRRIPGSLLSAKRAWWAEDKNRNTEVDYGSILGVEQGKDDGIIAKVVGNRPIGHYYSVLGTKDAPLDVSLCSQAAIDILLEMLTSERPAEGE